MEGDDALVPRQLPAQLDAVGLLLEPIFDLTRARHGPLSNWCILIENRSAESFAKDLVEDQSIVPTTGVFSLWFLESKPQYLSICPPGASAQKSKRSDHSFVRLKQT